MLHFENRNNFNFIGEIKYLVSNSKKWHDKTLVKDRQFLVLPKVMHDFSVVVNLLFLDCQNYLVATRYKY